MNLGPLSPRKSECPENKAGNALSFFLLRWPQREWHIRGQGPSNPTTKGVLSARAGPGSHRAGHILVLSTYAIGLPWVTRGRAVCGCTLGGSRPPCTHHRGPQLQAKSEQPGAPISRGDKPHPPFRQGSWKGQWGSSKCLPGKETRRTQNLGARLPGMRLVSCPLPASPLQEVGGLGDAADAEGGGLGSWEWVKYQLYQGYWSNL